MIPKSHLRNLRGECLHPPRALRDSVSTCGEASQSSLCLCVIQSVLMTLILAPKALMCGNFGEPVCCNVFSAMWQTDLGTCMGVAERFGKVLAPPLLPGRGCVISRRPSPPWHYPCVAQYLQSPGHPDRAEIIPLSGRSRQPRTGDDCPRSIIQNKV